MDMRAILDRYFIEALRFILAKYPLDETARLEQDLGLAPGEMKRVLAGEKVLDQEIQDAVAHYFGMGLDEFYYMGQDLKTGLDVAFTPRQRCSHSGCQCGDMYE